MKSVVLAAGFSTRLYPITRHFPKGLLRVGGREITGYVMDGIRDAGFADTVLVTNHRYKPLFDIWCGSRTPHVPVLDNHVDSPETRLGAIGDLLFTLDTTGWDDDILAVASDTLVSLDIADFVAFARKTGGVALPVFDCHDPEIIRRKLGCAVTDGDRLVSFVEKPDHPPTNLIGVPFYYYPKAVLPLIRQYAKDGGSLDAPGSLIPYLMQKTPCFAYRVTGYYFDVGTMATYAGILTNPGALKVPVPVP